jgi:hypothetical protein
MPGSFPGCADRHAPRHPGEATNVFRAPILVKYRLTFEGIKEPYNKCALTRFAVVAGPDSKMWLEHQTLPATAEALKAKPTFIG